MQKPSPTNRSLPVIIRINYSHDGNTNCRFASLVFILSADKMTFIAGGNFQLLRNDRFMVHFLNIKNILLSLSSSLVAKGNEERVCVFI